jgi:hypothetical protein
MEHGNDESHPTDSKKDRTMLWVTVAVDSVFLLFVLLLIADPCDPAFGGDMCPSDVLLPLIVVVGVIVNIILAVVAFGRRGSSN